MILDFVLSWLKVLNCLQFEAFFHIPDTSEAALHYDNKIYVYTCVYIGLIIMK